MENEGFVFFALSFWHVSCCGCTLHVFSSINKSIHPHITGNWGGGRGETTVWSNAPMCRIQHRALDFLNFNNKEFTDVFHFAVCTDIRHEVS